MSNNELYSVYCHILPNGKRYIGISHNPINRWKNGYGYRRNKIFYSDIIKYGWDNIQHEILYMNLSYQFAKLVEFNLIKEYDTLNRDKGYNLSPSGDSANVTLETRKKMSLKRIGNKYCLGHKTSDEKKKRISESLKKHYAPSIEHPNGIAGPNRGRKFSIESRKKLSDTKKNAPIEKKQEWAKRLPVMKGVNNPNSKKVLRIKGDEIVEFDCILDAIRNTGDEYYRQGILRCCKGIQKEYKGYSWQYV